MAAFSCFRLFRAFSSSCASITTFLGFCFLLTWIFILYQPTSGPGIVQRLGWQSWDIVSTPNDLTAAPQNGTGDTSSSHPGSTGDNPSDVDWWNVTETDEQFDSTSLPLDVWAPLLPHDTGLSEIAITRCFVNPDVAGDLCAPDSTSEQDAIKGKWVLVERNLNREGGYLSGYLCIYYRRTRRQDIDLITDIRLLPDREQPYPLDGWHKATLSLRAGISGESPLYLWYRTGKTLSQMDRNEKANIITEIDVLFGDDIPWYGFERIHPQTMFKTRRTEATWLTIRRGVKPPPRAPPPHFSKDGKYKILQVADLHYSVSQGLCRDTSLSPCEKGDNLTNTLLAHILDAEKPDLVVFSGDQVNGQGTSWDVKSVLAKFARAVTERGIPWTAVFGNHDQDDGYSKQYQVEMLKALPYSLMEAGPRDIHGVGNYVIKVMSADPSKTHLLTLYFLDSGSYSKGFLDIFGFFNPTEYDWIRQDQIDWFLQESASINQIERPFSPDTGKDFGSIWVRQGDDQILPSVKRLAKPNALMFFHIPLPEAYSKPDVGLSGKPLDVGISGQEPAGNAKKSDGFFEKGILQAFESDHQSTTNPPEVKVIANGHCHVTENCRRIKGVWLCFGGGGSYSGYGKIGFDRRFRVYDISDFGETIETYKRTEKDEIVDRMILSGKGAYAR